MSTRKNDARPSTAYAEPSAKGKYFTKEKQNTCISFFAGVNSARFRDFGKLILALYWERASLHSQRCAVHVAFEHCASVVLLAGCWRKCVCTLPVPSIHEDCCWAFRIATYRRRYAQAAIAVSEAKTFLAAFLIRFRILDPRPCSWRYAARCGYPGAVVARSRHPCVRP